MFPYTGGPFNKPEYFKDQFKQPNDKPPRQEGNDKSTRWESVRRTFKRVGTRYKKNFKKAADVANAVLPPNPVTGTLKAVGDAMNDIEPSRVSSRGRNAFQRPVSISAPHKRSNKILVKPPKGNPPMNRRADYYRQQRERIKQWEEWAGPIITELPEDAMVIEDSHNKHL